VTTHSVELLATSAVNLEDLEAGSDVPDVEEGNVGKLAAPFGGDAASAAQGHDHVAALFPEVKALVGT